MMIFPIVIVLAMFIVSRVLMPDTTKLKYSDNLQDKVEALGLEVGNELDLVLLKDRYEVHIYAKGITDEYGRLAVCRDEKIYKKVKKGQLAAKITQIAIGGMRIEFFDRS